MNTDAPLLRFTIPQPTPTLNALMSMHWAKQQRLRKQAQMVALRARMAAGLPAAEEPRRLIVTRYGARELDHDNLVGGCKRLVDGLKHAKVIVDDSPAWVQVEYRQERAKPKQRRTVVEVLARKEAA